MKGVINKGVQEFAVSRWGDDGWEQIKRRAGCEEPFFAMSLDYRDELTRDLLAAAAVHAQVEVPELERDLGRFVVTHTLPHHYPSYLQLGGSSAREFLKNTQWIHSQVTKGVPGAQPPHFEYDDLPDGGLCIHYRSERALCGFLRGIIEGVGELFSTPVTVQERSCVREGAPRCSLEVSF